MTVSKPRRDFLRLTALGDAAVPLAALMPGTARPEDAPLVSESDPTAKAVGYVHDVAKATAAKPGSTCGNCVLYQGAAGSTQGPCGLFQGKQVKAGGWCTAWTKKA